ncbi:MAG: hypothetical protein ACI8XO_000258, partial [Verrucomicrobiales bacterium]|jgi:hypothetical protein
MLSTGTEDPPVVKLCIDDIQAEADAELAEVFGGEGGAEMHFRSKWYVGGIWPFRRLSFECPGCSRWLSASLAHSDRLGICPSCALTLATPNVGQDSPAELVSSAKEISALPARRLPQSHQVAVATLGSLGAAARSAPAEQASDFKRFGSTDEEGEWGISMDASLVPIRVVTRFQSIVPWLTLIALLAAAGFVGKAFTAMGERRDDTPIPSTHPAKLQPKHQHGSDLWVVLDSLSTATTPDELSTMVRDSAEMLPKMQAFYAARPGVQLPHKFERARPGLKIYMLNGTRFARFEGRCDGRPVKFTFEETTYGWRLDWESVIGYSGTSWSDFLSQRPPGEHQFRVIGKMSSDDLIEYNRERYVCMQLTDHFETGDAFVLVDKFGLSAAKLEKFFEVHSKGISPRTWIIPVLKRSDQHDQLFEMVDLKSGSWLIP